LSVSEVYHNKTNIFERYLKIGWISYDLWNCVFLI